LGDTDYWRILNEEIDRADLRGAVTLSEAVSNQELPAYYAFAEMLVLPSYYEAFAKVVLEAMACGKPVIATRTGGLPEAVVDGVTGRLVPYGYVEALASAIVDLMQDQRTMAAMGRTSRSMVEKTFSWHAVADRVNNVYREISP